MCEWRRSLLPAGDKNLVISGSSQGNFLHTDAVRLEPPHNVLQPLRVGKRPGHLWLFRLLPLALIVVGQEALFRWEFPFPEVHDFNRISYQMLAQCHDDLCPLIKRGLVYDRLLVESRADGFSEIHNLNLYGFRGADFAIQPPGDGGGCCWWAIV